ncbi:MULTISPECIES: GNAT family N-acetyltransferase [Streptomyces]|uniref:GNAT family N-acetyltransferase n=1 Tax=Streptomyces TaxID=1883 RepID=UPI0013AE0E39|nr:GNAT family N-acetyltransferase [Streptomyces sennicomposti]MBY8869535.1 GNAT family N-acetyltransferase [Streptomyces sennicomposti]MYS42930.1 GNAT family N-acetyltransferase [Streptomyces sp. SID5998]
MDTTGTGRSTVTAADWRLSDEVPERVAASCLYDSAGWLRAWEDIGIEKRSRHAYVHTDPEHPDGASVLPLYAVHECPFWDGYERQVDLVGRFGNPVIFAGSPYSMYGKRGHVPAALVRGAHATAMEWIASGPAELLVVPNLTEEGVADWLETAGPPVGRILLERTYSCDLDLDAGFDQHMFRVTNKIRRDVQRRLRRADERGLTIRMVEGPEAHALVPAAYPLTVDTSDKNDWPALFDEDALHGMLRVPGAMMVAAEVDGRLVGAFFAFRRGSEVTFMCGGVAYATLHDLSTYVALMYRSTEWAYEQGMRRLEWGRDNYRFKERHALTGTDLWALVYAPEPRPDLEPALAHMDRVLSAYIRGD